MNVVDDDDDDRETDSTRWISVRNSIVQMIRDVENRLMDVVLAKNLLNHLNIVLVNYTDIERYLHVDEVEAPLHLETNDLNQDENVS